MCDASGYRCLCDKMPVSLCLRYTWFHFDVSQTPEEILFMKKNSKWKTPLRIFPVLINGRKSLRSLALVPPGQVLHWHAFIPSGVFFQLVLGHTKPEWALLTARDVKSPGYLDFLWCPGIVSKWLPWLWKWGGEEKRKNDTKYQKRVYTIICLGEQILLQQCPLCHEHRFLIILANGDLE